MTSGTLCLAYPFNEKIIQQCFLHEASKKKRKKKRYNDFPNLNLKPVYIERKLQGILKGIVKIFLFDMNE